MLHLTISVMLQIDTEQEKDPKFWNVWAQKTLKNALTLQSLNKNKAKNLILFLGDGKILYN